MSIEYGHPYAEGAKGAQRTQKKPLKMISGFFCVFCVIFAPSAYGCPIPPSKRTP